MTLKHVERRPVAEEIGFVIEQSLDNLLRQARLPSHDKNRNQLVECRDPPLPQKRRERGFDSPAAAHRQLLSGTRLEQASEDPAGAVAYLHAAGSSVRPAIRRAILSGGSAAEANP